MRVRSSFILTTVALIVTGCVGPKAAPTLNLNYTPSTQQQLSNTIIVATVLPRFTGVQKLNDDSTKEIGPDETIPQLYKNRYAAHLQNSLQADLEKILKVKGFTVIGASMEEMPRAEKQKADFIAVISFDFMPEVNNFQKVMRYPTGTVRIMNEGSLRFVGTLVLEFREPLSNETLFAHKIDVGSFGANTPREYEDDKGAEEKFTELLNEIYPRIMTKLEKSMQPREFEAALPASKRLKEKHQPAAENKAPQ